ncbi:MAG: hypothetical protein NTU72_09910 [Fimbriimonadales bacterium]|nr:hypothetical protein [Fimbriimonadales bacterium]
MDRDYSWEDQDPEEMQSWHEFQGEIAEPKFIDSVAFQFDETEIVDDQYSDDADE